ncbi:MAG TPA: 2-oxoacid:acceptor oxidoreductase family protein [bacterium]|nr:2-oxoacid:acceptor oxidoreductase family protein [bacterium]
MSEMVEIRWHGRGGQGAKTAAFLLAESLIDQGKYAQGFPDYGPERMGAPIRGYNRISETPVGFHCDVRTPDIVVVLDPTLIGSDDITAGLADDGVVIVNSPLSAEQIRRELHLQGRQVYTVDATGIALKEIGRPIPNLPMIGSLLKVRKLSDMASMERIVAKKFEGKFSKQVIDGNMKAMKRGYDEIKGEK